MEVDPLLPLIAPLPVPHQVAPLPRIRSFSQYYSEESNDPCKRNYARVMNRFDASRVNAVPERTQLDQAIGLSAQTAHAYLCCGLAPGGLKIYCVHCPTRYAASLEGDVTGWGNLCFAFLGELVQGAITNVLFPEDTFSSATLNVPTIAYIQQHLDCDYS
jgi:hypothetical protein